jgi:tetratricopeptide (TPR) repeat protein
MNNETARSRERRSARRPGKRRLVTWSIIIVLLLGVGISAKFCYHRLKTWRANHFAEQGQQLVAVHKFEEAAEKYRAALQLDPLNPNALRAAARLAAQLGRPEAADLWKEVIKLPEATAQDREDYAELLVHLGQLKVAEPILQDLLKGAPDARTLSTAATFARQNGDRQRAIEFARLAAKSAPNDEAMQFQLATLLALATDRQEQVEAKGILWGLARKPGQMHLPAIQALAKAPDLSTEEKTQVLQMLEASKSKEIMDALAAADLRLQLHPEQADQIYDQTIAGWNSSGTADLTTLARWLNTHQQPDRVLSLFSLDQAFKDNQLLLARLDALGIQQRWDEIDALLTHPDLTLDPSVLESFRARTSQEKGAAMDAELHWMHAISLAAGDPFKLRFVANFAEQSKTYGIALKAYDQLARFPNHADFAYRATQRLSSRTGDLTAGRAAAEKIAARTPDDPNASAQLAYMNLLANVDVDANAATAKSLVEKYPDRLSYRVTAALALLRQNDPGAAMAQFQPAGAPPIEWDKTPPAWRAVYAAILRATEQEEAAQHIIDTIPKDKLSAEERRLIE